MQPLPLLYLISALKVPPREEADLASQGAAAAAAVSETVLPVRAGAWVTAAAAGGVTRARAGIVPQGGESTSRVPDLLHELIPFW